MASESRKKPESNVTRNTALTKAKEENDDLVAAGTSFLSAATTAMLNTTQVAYKEAYDTVAEKSNDDVLASDKLEKAAALLKRGCSRFIQVLVLAVEDGDFPAANLHYYHLDSSGKLPNMNSYDEIQNCAANLISGEAARVAAGGAAMANPNIGVITHRNTAFLDCRTTKRATTMALTAAETALNKLNADADETILFVWNEVEAHFSNLSPAARRVQGRIWGIIYAKVGGTKEVSGTVKDSLSGNDILDANVFFENGVNDALSDAHGYKLNTTLMDTQILLATHPLYVDFKVSVVLVEGENPVVNIVMVKKP